MQSAVGAESPVFIMHSKVTDDEVNRLQDAVRIGFVGDLMLQRDMVEDSCHNNDGFDGMFSAMKGYFSECDLMTAVLNGPFPGGASPCTSANYDDIRGLLCAFPDEYFHAIQRSGIGFLSLADCNLYDRGADGAKRTAGLLEAHSLPYVGYGNKARTLLTVKGIKIAVLAYTESLNGKTEDYFFDEGNECVAHPILSKTSKYYKRCLETVRSDFEWAMAQKPQCIIVYPHAGSRFSHSLSENQLHWFDVFRSLGADIIFGSGAQVTQPLWFDGNHLYLGCAGNYFSNYLLNDGDCSAMVEVYLDKTTGKPFAAAMIPMLANASCDSVLAPYPMCRLAESDVTGYHEKFRLNQAHKTVTSTMLGVEIPISQAQSRYVIMRDNMYRRLPCEHTLDDVPQNVLQFFRNGQTVAFIGDSVTEGTENGGYGWFEPFIATLRHVKVINISKGGYTTKTIIRDYGECIRETVADIFCIALGCNDIRYRDKDICAMTADEFGIQTKQIISLIRAKNTKAEIALIAPWWSDDIYDDFCKPNREEKHFLYEAFSVALSDVAAETGSVFVNPNPTIWETIRSGRQSKYLQDWIHPTASDGITLFSQNFVSHLSRALATR